MFSQPHFLSYFTPATFCLFQKSEIRAGKLLVVPGHPQEELVGGRPHHRYIKARRCRPWVDRALQKNTHTAENYAKKIPEASISLKWTVFKLCCPAHLFPNTPCTLWNYLFKGSGPDPDNEVWGDSEQAHIKSRKSGASEPNIFLWKAKKGVYSIEDRYNIPALLPDMMVSNRVQGHKDV